jgi:tRNA uridine 5-carboxymethylaminomethyl modification enzyme
MFTSRAEHRLLLRADNAADRLTPAARALGLLGSTELGRRRWGLYESRRASLEAVRGVIERGTIDGTPLSKAVRRPEFTAEDLGRVAGEAGISASPSVIFTSWADARYEAYLRRERAEIRRHAELESKRLPPWLDYGALEGLRREAAEALARFRPETFGQAGRLEGVTPADLSLLAVHARRGPDRSSRRASSTAV